MVRSFKGRDARIFSLYTETPFTLDPKDWEFVYLDEDETKELWRKSILYNGGHPWLI